MKKESSFQNNGPSDMVSQTFMPSIDVVPKTKYTYWGWLGF